MAKVTARFEKMVDASNAVKMLKRIGVTNTWLDAMDDFSGEFAAEFNVPGMDNAPSLSGLVLNSGGYAARADKGPLLAADPMVSGMEPREETARNHSTRLVANVPNEQIDAVKRVISDMDGDMETH